jgi:hypothetical protein
LLLARGLGDAVLRVLRAERAVTSAPDHLVGFVRGELPQTPGMAIVLRDASARVARL